MSFTASDFEEDPFEAVVSRERYYCIRCDREVPEKHVVCRPCVTEHASSYQQESDYL